MFFDAGFGAGVAASPPNPNDSIGVWQGIAGQSSHNWVSYYAANSSRGAPNPPPAPLHSTVADGAVLGGETVGLAWSGLSDAVEYEFELAPTPDFAAPLVQSVTAYPGWRPAAPLGPRSSWSCARHSS